RDRGRSGAGRGRPARSSPPFGRRGRPARSSMSPAPLSYITRDRFDGPACCCAHYARGHGKRPRRRGTGSGDGRGDKLLLAEANGLTATSLDPFAPHDFFPNVTSVATVPTARLATVNTATALVHPSVVDPTAGAALGR